MAALKRRGVPGGNGTYALLKLGRQDLSVLVYEPAALSRITSVDMAIRPHASVRVTKPRRWVIPRREYETQYHDKSTNNDEHRDVRDTPARTAVHGLHNVRMHEQWCHS